MDYWFLRRNFNTFYVLHCSASTILFLSHNGLVRCQINWMHFADITHTLFSWPQTKGVLHSDTVLGTAAIVYINHLMNFAFCCILLHGCQRIPLTSCASSLETCWPVSLHFLPHLCKLTKHTPYTHVNKAQQVEEGTYTVSVSFKHVYKHHEALEAKKSFNSNNDFHEVIFVHKTKVHFYQSRHIIK